VSQSGSIKQAQLSLPTVPKASERHRDSLSTLHPIATKHSLGMVVVMMMVMNDDGGDGDE
jgi:hypothetical protein